MLNIAVIGSKLLMHEHQFAVPFTSTTRPEIHTWQDRMLPRTSSSPAPGRPAPMQKTSKQPCLIMYKETAEWKRPQNFLERHITAKTKSDKKQKNWITGKQVYYRLVIRYIVCEHDNNWNESTRCHSNADQIPEELVQPINQSSTSLNQFIDRQMYRRNKISTTFYIRPKNTNQKI